VVMPVYNGERHLASAMASILAQTFADFELIAVNDGSRDTTAKILRRFAQRDPRVRVIQQENCGLVGALNRGLEEVRGPLIARMDADDIAMPDRFEKQLAFLETHPSVLAVGSAILNIDADGDPLNVQVLESDPLAIDHCLMQRRTGMAHPAVMMRRDPVRELGGYRAEFEWIEDHDLWLRLSERGPLANLPEVLLCYRQHLDSCSWNNSALRARRINGVLTDAYRRRKRPMPADLLLREEQVRSAGGPHKYIRAAIRAGQWQTAKKHLREQWRQHPRSFITFRSTLEAGLRAVGALFRSNVPAPRVPAFTTEQLCSPPQSDSAPQRSVA